MNCDDITSILDDGEFDRLTANELHQLETHLAGCTACAAEYTAHRAVLEAAVPDLPTLLEPRCRAHSGPNTSHPVRHASARPVVIGALLLVGAAAAAMLSVQLLSDEEENAVPAVAAATTDATDPAAADSTTANGATAQTESVGAAPDNSIGEVAAIEPAEESGRYTVVVTPLRQTATDPEAVRRSEALYLAFTDALRAIPNLQLVEIEREADQVQDQPEQSLRPVSRDVPVPALTEDTTAAADPLYLGASIANMRGQGTAFGTRTLTLVDSRRVTPTNNADAVDMKFIPSALTGRVETITGSATATYGADAMAGVVNVILDNNVENIRVDLNYMAESGSADESLSHDFELDVSAGQDRDQGQFSVNARSRKGPRLSIGTDFSLSDMDYLDEALQRLIEPLRQRLFPPDAERLEATRMRVMDPALSAPERLQAFDELKRSDNQWNNGAVQDRVLYSMIDMAATTIDITMRVFILQSLQDVASPILVAPLSNTLLNDPNEVVRLQSARALAGLADDPTARAALALAADIDPSAEIRMNARWASLDDAGRRGYVLGTLLDARLTDSERLAPLLFQPDWTGGGMVDITPGIDADVTRQLTALLRRTDSIDVRASVLTRLYPMVSTGLVPLYLDRLRDDPSEQVRNAAAFGLRSQLDEPGVRFALEQAAAGDPSADIRSAAAFVLANED